MNILLSNEAILSIPADLLIVGAFEESKLSGAAAAVDAALAGALSKRLEQSEYAGALGETFMVPILPSKGEIKAKMVCVLGLGKKNRCNADALRKAGGYVVKTAKAAKAKRVAMPLLGTGSADACACALGEGIRLSAYAFREHFGKGRNGKDRAPAEIVIAESDPARAKLAANGLEEGRVLADATSLARDLVNTSPRHMHPRELADRARALAVRGSGISCRIFDRVAMENMGMGAALAVADGSDHPPLFVHLVYRPTVSKSRAKQVRKIALVGKAITFDSGGLNIKPGDSMTNMKIDMAGAASVIGCFAALAALKLPVEVHGVFAALENMPSGHAYRPGDVVTAMNGMTIEILNTDAEGRVTLADALSYTVKKIKPDAMIDLATLTGAVIIALGDDCAALMANDRKLANAVLSAADRAGELVWELPLLDAYDDALNSKVADMNNTGGRSAGTIKGGLFLKRFAGETPWVHLDIAGPVFAEKESRPDVPYGGTGFGVRTLIAYLQGVAKT